MAEDRSDHSQPSPQVQQAIIPDQAYEAPSFTSNEVTKMVVRLYGLNVQKITELESFNDQNFRITLADSSNDIVDFILKVINAKKSSDVDFMRGMINILLYLEEKGIKCPKPVKMLDGDYLSWHRLPGGAEHAVYLQTYIHGVPLTEVEEISLQQFQSLGCYLGKMDKELQRFQHPGFLNENNQWRIENIPDLSKYLPEVCDGVRRKLVSAVLQSFEDKVVPVYGQIRQGIIHCDYSPRNIIVQPSDVETSGISGDIYAISGIIDFGDVKYSTYLYEIAISMASFVMEDATNKSFVAKTFLAGYETEFPLTEQEKSLLEICSLARLTQLAILSSLELKRQPTNKYVERVVKMAWKSLERYTREWLYTGVA
ncbi:hydroxylysine kinase-like [Ptychodera flava]|uniref:hydroxylysine kinase-like n=1 Tax=Ptychodera flava TaxID=63121 RepID=UPI00396A17E7